MNEVNLLGRLTKEPDMRYLDTGKAMVMFTLAVQRSYKNKQGEYEADFIRCKAFGKTAEVMAEYLMKGNRVAVNGEIQTGSYEKNGQRVFTTDVLVNQFTFIDSKNDKTQNTNNQSSQFEKRSYNQEQAQKPFQQIGGNNEPDPFENSAEPVDISDNDLPF